MKAGDGIASAAALLLLACAPPLGAQTRGFPDDAAMQRELRAFVEDHRGAPGVIVGLLDAGGRRVHVYGESGRRERPGLDGDTRFEIGSITKTFTGILLADMILAGELSAGQRVAMLFPPTMTLDNGVQDATLEGLATHTSGLTRIGVDLPALSRTMSLDPYRGTTADDVYSSAARVPRMLVTPTTSPAYSNLGYALLGRLLERQGGQAYEQLLRQRVLEPLGLGSITTAHTTPPSLATAQGHGHGGRPTPYWHVDGYAPAGCLIASANEMLEYVAINLAVSNPAVAEAQRPRKAFAGSRAIGLGWFHAKIGGHRLIWHNGMTGGFRSFVGFLPDEGRGFVVLANGQGDVDALARRLLDPAEPPLAGHDANVWIGIAITLVLLAWGPLTLWGSIRRSGPTALPLPSAPAAIDRLDVLRSPLTPAIALVLAARLGAWQELPFAAWWVALAIVVIAVAILARQAPVLPWRRGGVWNATSRGLMTALEVGVLVLLFS
jgi:CubicO group peptidase (beta-lactamase class C family)